MTTTLFTVRRLAVVTGQRLDNQIRVAVHIGVEIDIHRRPEAEGPGIVPLIAGDRDRLKRHVEAIGVHPHVDVEAYQLAVRSGSAWESLVGDENSCHPEPLGADHAVNAWVVTQGRHSVKSGRLLFPESHEA